MTDKATIEARVSRKGLRSGALTEYTIVGKVKPGHEKAARDALTSHLTDPRRSDVEVLKKVGIHTALTRCLTTIRGSWPPSGSRTTSTNISTM